MLLYGTLVMCALVVAVVVYRYDLYDREPLLLLILATVLGMGAMHLAGRVQVFWLVRAGSDALSDRWIISLLAGTHEELAKALVVLVMGLIFRRIFNEPLDGLIYGSFAGLGAALDESISVLRHLEPGETLPPAELLRITGHLVMGGIGGFGFGYLWLRRWWPLRAAASLGVAMVLHFAWDVVAVPANDTGEMSTPSRVFAMLVMLAGLALYATMVHQGAAISRGLFGATPPALWAWPFRGARRRP